MLGSKQLDQEGLQNSIKLALNNWNKAGVGEGNSIADLLLVQNRLNHSGQNNDRLSVNQAVFAVLLDAIDQLAQQDDVGAAVLRQRFIDGDITRRVATKMHASPDQVNRWQRAALSNLSQIIFDQEMALRKELITQLSTLLPLSPPVDLFGCDEALSLLTDRLLTDGKPYLIAITGIGGIGKTSLANALSRKIIPTLAFKNILWLQAGRNFSPSLKGVPENIIEPIIFQLADQLKLSLSGGQSSDDLLRRLHHLLSEERSLVIIDDLETEAQASAVLSEIVKLANPSKFVLTTRARPIIDSPVFYYLVTELSFADARDLIIHHAQVLGTDVLANADDAIFSSIYETTGGNPLALKLVVGLASVLPLEQILAGLRQSRPGPIESLYRRIYWEAWRTLSPAGQALLQAMPLVAESGGNPDQMRSISDLSEVEFWMAVRELYSRSLIESQGPVDGRKYSIHRLTETFLRTEIIDWPLDELDGT